MVKFLPQKQTVKVPILLLQDETVETTMVISQEWVSKRSVEHIGDVSVSKEILEA